MFWTSCLGRSFSCARFFISSCIAAIGKAVPMEHRETREAKMCPREGLAWMTDREEENETSVFRFCPGGHHLRYATPVADEQVEEGEATMNRKVKPAGIFVMVSLLVLFGSTAMAGSDSTQDDDISGGSCPYQEVENVQGSKIRFLEDTYDFGQIPVNRMISHNFRFQNVGTAPLSLAPHVTSKAIEGC